MVRVSFVIYCHAIALSPSVQKGPGAPLPCLDMGLLLRMIAHFMYIARKTKNIQYYIYTVFLNAEKPLGTEEGKLSAFLAFGSSCVPVRDSKENIKI